MSKKRVSKSQDTARGPNLKSFKKHAFVGVALAGGKSDKTCMAYLEYYPQQNKIFLSQLLNNLKTEGDISADLIFHEEVLKHKLKIEYIAYNVPLSLPKCLTCKLKCPGYENCNEEEILWMWDHYRKLEAEGRQKKLFTPYTERCAEQYLGTELEESFQPQHALGANMAPLTARALFINRRLRMNAIEVFPRLSLWRIGRHLNIHKTHLRFHKHQAGGIESREAILKELQRRNIAFLYEQDVRQMIDNSNAFDAFICALTAVLKFKNQCEKRPKDFPKSEGWIEIPNEDIVW